MRVAQVSPLYESVPPKSYGGTERVVSYLTEELVRMGHDVTLFASGDSTTAARLIAPCEQSLRLSKKCIDVHAHHVLQLELVTRHCDSFDVIHYHTDYFHFPLSRRMKTPNVTTLHGRLDIPDLRGLYAEFADAPLISISNSQRRPLRRAHWVGTVYHGLPDDLYQFHPTSDGYLAFIGRFSPEKRPDRAIKIAKTTGMPIKVAAKIDRSDKAYFERVVRPLLDDPLVEYVGEIGEKEKDEFLGRAAALIFPIEWPEPFGLVMIEAMACGTPVIATAFGAVPEVLEHGTTGIIVSRFDDLPRAVEQIDKIDRKRCRETFLERFTARRMAADYVRIFEQMLGSDISSHFELVKA
jgi:glycosyltransferase involved in cell wall biosynthesis